MIKSKNNKKSVFGVALSAVMLVSTVFPASASTVKYTFTEFNNVYGITAKASGQSGYVTAWAKVSNTNKGAGF